MGTDFDEDVDAAVQNTLDRLLEQYRFADIMPPVFRVEFRSFQQGAGDSRVEGGKGLARLEFCQGLSDTGFDLVHDRAVKCVVKIQPFIEDAPFV